MRRPLSAIVAVLMLVLLPFCSAGGVQEGPPSVTTFGSACPAPIPVVQRDAARYLSAIDGHFTENLGQLDEDGIYFYCIGSPLSVAFGASRVHYDFRPGCGPEGVSIEVGFVGSNSVQPVGVGPMDHRSNFFLGDDPSRWVSGARNFRGVTFPSLYDGIDLHYHMMDGRLKYDFVVAPGAEPTDIRVSFEGVEGLHVDEAAGDLVIQTEVGALRDDPPIASQGGGRGSTPISVGYHLESTTVFTWDLGPYDRSMPLVIDPGLEFSTYVGGSGDDTINVNIQFDVDEEGNCYIGGNTKSLDFPTTPGSYKNVTTNGDSFVFKLSNDGSKLLYCTYIGGSYFWEPIYCVRVDGEGCAYVSGMTFSDDFPTTPGAINDTFLTGYTTYYLSKLDAKGSTLVYSTFICAGAAESSILVDDYGRVLFGASVTLDHVPTVQGCLNTTKPGNMDAFILLINHDATKVVAGTYYGGNDHDELYSMSSLDGKSFLMSMQTASKGLRVGDDAYMTTHPGYRCCYVARISTDLTRVIDATYLGGSQYSYPYNVLSEGPGRVCVAGYTSSSDFPTTSNALDKYIDTSWGDAFISVLDEKLENLLFSTFYGGSDYEKAGGIDWTPQGELLIVGDTRSDDFRTTPDAHDRTHQGDYDIFVLRLNSDYTLKYATLLGGSGSESAYSTIHYDGNVTVAGGSTSTDYPTTPGALDTSLGGRVDIVVTRLWAGIAHDATPPRAPRGLSATSGNRNVSLSWKAPKGWSGGPILSYNLYRGPTSEDLTLVASLADDVREHTDHPPVIGRTYYYAISAVNGKGEGDMCPAVPVVCIGAPDVPRDVSTELGPQSAVITWSPPRDSGGFPLLGYRLLRGTEVGDLAHLVDLGNVTGHKDEGLTNGVEYYYQVVAYNIYGNSTPTQPVSVMPKAPPSEPRYVEITVANGQVTLEWTIPEFENGSRLLGYRIHRGADPDDLSEIDAISDSFTIYTDTGLTNGVTYHFAIQAFNAMGNGSLSEVVSGTPIGVPWAPTNLKFETGDGTVTLSWDPPVNDGGRPVTNYTVYRGPTELSYNLVGHVGGTTFEDTGLENGMLYLYRVSASNELGEGPRTGSVSAVPMGLPDPPDDLKMAADLDGIHLDWQPPWETGGASITGYIVYRGTDPTSMERLTELPDTVEELTDGDVTAGHTYHYRVSALTLEGEGPPTATVSMTAVAPPGPPTEVRAEAGNGQVHLTWSPPEDNGSLPIEGYTVMRWTRGEPVEELARLGPVAFHVDNDVENDQEYLYYVVARNSIAQGPKSKTVIVTPTVPKFAPSQPLELELRAHGDKAVLTWEVPLHNGGAPITGYIVMRGSSPDDLEEVARLDFIHSYVDDGIAIGARYFYTVRAVNDAGGGTAIEPQPFIIQQVEDTTGDEEEGLPWSVVAVSVTVAVAIVALLALFVVRRGRGGAGQEASGDQGETDDEGPPEEEGPEAEEEGQGPSFEIEIEERTAR